MVIDCPSPERGLLGISIGDRTLKCPILSFTLLSARELLKISILFHFKSRRLSFVYYYYYIFAE